jgi:hypothetical protein
MVTDIEWGPVETQVRRDIDALMNVHPMGEALAEMSFSLARALDGDLGGMARAALNRELRQNLVQLADMGVGDDDDLDSQLSTPDGATEVRDGEDS